MQVVPLQPVPNQTLQCQLGGQPCTIEVAQNAYGLFTTLFVGKTLIIAGVLSEDLNRIVRSLYLGFSGDLAFVDTQGTDDPVFTGLGSRWQLLYLAPSDLPSGEG